MTTAEKLAIKTAYFNQDEDVRSSPATEAELLAFEAQFGPIPADFRWFLGTCGSCPIGAEWVDDIEALAESHRKFTEEVAAGYWQELKDVFIVGWDGGGNPYGIHGPTGELRVEDHNFGGLHVMARSFATFCLEGLA